MACPCAAPEAAPRRRSDGGGGPGAGGGGGGGAGHGGAAGRGALPPRARPLLPARGALLRRAGALLGLPGALRLHGAAPRARPRRRRRRRPAAAPRQQVAPRLHRLLPHARVADRGGGLPVPPARGAAGDAAAGRPPRVHRHPRAAGAGPRRQLHGATAARVLRRPPGRGAGRAAAQGEGAPLLLPAGQAGPRLPSPALRPHRRRLPQALGRREPQEQTWGNRGGLTEGNCGNGHEGTAGTDAGELGRLRRESQVAPVQPRRGDRVAFAVHVVSQGKSRRGRRPRWEPGGVCRPCGLAGGSGQGRAVSWWASGRSRHPCGLAAGIGSRSMSAWAEINP